MTSPFNLHKHSDSTSSTSSQQSHIWGALASSTAFITPTQFKKHANALMTQVEKSLTLPPPDSEPPVGTSTSTAVSSSSTAVKSPVSTKSAGRAESDGGRSELRARSRAGTAARSDGNA